MHIARQDLFVVDVRRTTTKLDRIGFMYIHAHTDKPLVFANFAVGFVGGISGGIILCPFQQSERPGRLHYSGRVTRPI